jgi:hypothetical protein
VGEGGPTFKQGVGFLMQSDWREVIGDSRRRPDLALRRARRSEEARIFGMVVCNWSYCKLAATY